MFNQYTFITCLIDINSLFTLGKITKNFVPDNFIGVITLNRDMIWFSLHNGVIRTSRGAEGLIIFEKLPIG